MPQRNFGITNSYLLTGSFMKKETLKAVSEVADRLIKSRKETDQFRQELLNCVKPLDKLLSHIKGNTFEGVDDQQTHQIVVGTLEDLLTINNELCEALAEEPFNVDGVKELLRSYGGNYELLVDLAEEHPHMATDDFIERVNND